VAASSAFDQPQPPDSMPEAVQAGAAGWTGGWWTGGRTTLLVLAQLDGAVCWVLGDIHDAVREDAVGDLAAGVSREAALSRVAWVAGSSGGDHTEDPSRDVRQRVLCETCSNRENVTHVVVGTACNLA
jgi:hypothetical protein